MLNTKALTMETGKRNLILCMIAAIIKRQSESDALLAIVKKGYGIHTS